MRKGTPRREIVNIDTADTTSLEMDIPNGEGFVYAPKVFTNQNYAATLPQTETECSDLEVVQNNFIGEYCEKCIKKHNRCWCNGSDWDVDLMEVELPNSPTTNPSNKTKQPNSLTQISIRQPLQAGQNLEKASLMLYNVLLPINRYSGNSTTKSCSRSYEQ